MTEQSAVECESPSNLDEHVNFPGSEVNRLLQNHAIKVNAHLHRSSSWSVALEAHDAQALRLAFDETQQGQSGTNDGAFGTQQSMSALMTNLDTDRGMPCAAADLTIVPGEVVASSAPTSSSHIPVGPPQPAAAHRELSAEGALRRESMMTRRAFSDGFLGTSETTEQHLSSGSYFEGEQEVEGQAMNARINSDGYSLLEVGGVGEVIHKQLRGFRSRPPSVKGPNSVVPLGLILDPELRAVWTARDELADAEHSEDDEEESEEEEEEEEDSLDESESDEDESDEEDGESSSAGELTSDAESDVVGADVVVNTGNEAVITDGSETEAALMLAPTAAIVADVGGTKVSLLSHNLSSSAAPASLVRGRVSASRVRRSYLDRLGFDRTGGKKRSSHHKRKKKSHMGPNARRAALASARARRKPAVRVPLTEPKKAGLKRSLMNKLTRWIVGDDAPPSSLDQDVIDGLALSDAAAVAAAAAVDSDGGIVKETARRGVLFEPHTYVYFIPMRKEIAPEVRRQLWPTRHEFATMVMRNMDAAEREMHEKANRHRNPVKASAAPERLTTPVAPPASANSSGSIKSGTVSVSGASSSSQPQKAPISPPKAEIKSDVTSRQYVAPVPVVSSHIDGDASKAINLSGPVIPSSLESVGSDVSSSLSCIDAELSPALGPQVMPHAIVNGDGTVKGVKEDVISIAPVAKQSILE